MESLVDTIGLFSVYFMACNKGRLVSKLVNLATTGQQSIVIRRFSDSEAVPVEKSDF